LPICTLPYYGKYELNIVVDIHGVEKELCVLVDTGFTSDTGFGLALPSSFANYAMFTGTGNVTVADGREVAVASIPDAKIKKIEQHKLGNSITVPALFMNGPDGTIGVLFLQKCSLIFDGPSSKASISF
jgi:predicted aspartyl protease